MITGFTLMPFMVALLVAVAGMPTNVFQVNRRGVGTLEIEPWRQKTAASLARAVAASTAWLIRVMRMRWPVAVTAAVLLALLAADLSSAHAAGIVLATGPVVVPVNVDGLRQERATLIREAEALRPNGIFANDEARAGFDTRMSRVEAIDAELTRAAAPAPTPTPDTAAVREAAITEERTRANGITQLVRSVGLDQTVADDLVRRGVPMDAARTTILERLAARSDSTGIVGQVSMGEDARDKFLRGAGNWLLVKSGMAHLVARAANPTAPNVAAIEPGEFRGMTLVDLAREVCERAGIKTRGMDKMTLAGAAFTVRSSAGIIAQTTSDFTTLLENVMNKVLQAQYAMAPNTWSRWCATGSVSDFRAHNRYRMGMFSSLDALTEAGEFKQKALSDAEKATITAATKGNIVGISRQMIVNDDMGAFTRILSMLGQAAALSVEVDAYALLAQNSGLGPTQSDSQALFHANRSNVGTGAALSAASIDADRVVMGSQRDPWGNVYLELRPAVLLLPLSLGGQARVINQSQYDPDAVSNKAQMKPNVVAGLYRDIVDTARLTGTRRYSFADPNIAPVFEVAFLEGQTSPVLESREGWRQDGTEMRVRFDYGVAAVDYRGAVTNAGA